MLPVERQGLVSVLQRLQPFEVRTHQPVALGLHRPDLLLHDEETVAQKLPDLVAPPVPDHLELQGPLLGAEVTLAIELLDLAERLLIDLGEGGDKLVQVDDAAECRRGVPGAVPQRRRPAP